MGLFYFQLKELYTLLNENYVEDDDNMFRFDYSPEFLQWSVMIRWTPKVVPCVNSVSEFSDNVN